MSDSTTSMISLYNTLFMVFLALAIAFLLISVLLFFKFNIRGIWEMKSGKAMKRSIKELEAINAQTGRLLPRGGKIGSDRLILEFSGEMEGSNTTESRQTRQVGGSEVTTVLSDSGGMPAQAEKTSAQNGAFQIKQSIVLVHTNEII